MKNVHLNKATWLRLRTSLTGSWRRLPRVLLIERVYVVRLVILLVWIATILVLATRILFFTSAAPGPSKNSLQLSTAAIDELEAWIEERQLERETPRLQRSEIYFTP